LPAFEVFLPPFKGFLPAFKGFLPAFFTALLTLLFLPFLLALAGLVAGSLLLT